MNPPINRENLRDVLIALALAGGLTWGIAAFRGRAVGTSPALATMVAQLASSPKAAKKAAQAQPLLTPSDF